MQSDSPDSRAINNKQLPIDILEMKLCKNPAKYLKYRFFDACSELNIPDSSIANLDLQKLDSILRLMGFEVNQFQLEEGYNFACFENKYGSLLKKFSRPENKRNNSLQIDQKNISLQNQYGGGIRQQLQQQIQQPVNNLFDIDCYIQWLLHSANTINSDIIQSKTSPIKQQPSKQNQSGSQNQNQTMQSTIGNKSTTTPNTIQLPSIFNDRRQNYMVQNQSNRSQFNSKYRVKSFYSAQNRSEYQDNDRNKSGILENQFTNILSIFEKMDQLRQDHGLIPMDMEPEEGDPKSKNNEHLIKQQPYDPDLSDLNLQISKLRNNAEQRIRDFIDRSRGNQHLQRQLIDGIQQFQRERIMANERIGKIGAIQAKKRINQTIANQQTKLRDDLDFILLNEDNLLQNQKFFQFMSVNDKPKLNFQKKIKTQKQRDRLNYLLKNKQLN